MDLITALAVSIGVLGGIATFVFLSPFGWGLHIWAAFIAWATFYHCGGKEAGLTKAITQTSTSRAMSQATITWRRGSRSASPDRARPPTIQGKSVTA